MTTTQAQRQALVGFITSKISPAVNLLGADKLQNYENMKEESTQFDRWANQLSTSGDTLLLRNEIRLFVNLKSEGYDDFSLVHQKLGAQYRQYLSIAQSVVAEETAELNDLQAQLTAAQKLTDPVEKQVQTTVLTTQISVQYATIAAAEANVSTWQKTLNDALISGAAV